MKLPKASRRLYRKALPGGRKLLCYGAGSWQVMHPDSRVRIHVFEATLDDAAVKGRPWRVLAPSRSQLNILERRGDFRTLWAAALFASRIHAHIDALARLRGDG